MIRNDRYGWFAIYTKSRHENKVLERLTDKGIEAYLPLVPKISQWKDRKKRVEEPVIRGYVFVKIDNQLRLSVLQTDGVVYFVKIGNSIPEIPEWQIEALKTFINKFGINVELSGYEKFLLGEKVVVTDGALKGVKGSVIARGKKVRFAVGIDSIKSSFSVEIDPDFLKSIE